MIVHPDFLDHWKTKRLIEMTGEPTAPQMILRLWAHCQRQRNYVFENLSGDAVASICHSKIPGDKLVGFLLESGFLRREEKTLIVHDWEQVNRMLVSAWINGKKGGHPTKPTGNQPATSRLPVGNRPSRAGVREEDKNKIRAGYRPVLAKDTGDQPATDLASPEKEEKGDPANTVKFGQLCNEIANKLKSGEL